MQRLQERLVNIASQPANSKRFKVVATQGTLPNETDWLNELHPTKKGFEKIARKIYAEMLKVTPELSDVDEDQLPASSASKATPELSDADEDQLPASSASSETVDIYSPPRAWIALANPARRDATSSHSAAETGGSARSSLRMLLMRRRVSLSTFTRP